MYETDQYGSKKNKKDAVQANRAETKLHELVKNKFKPPVMRMTFTSGNESEWFNIPEEKMPQFLKFCDEQIYNKIIPNVLGATYFKKSSFGLI